MASPYHLGCSSGQSIQTPTLSSGFHILCPPKGAVWHRTGCLGWCQGCTVQLCVCVHARVCARGGRGGWSIHVELQHAGTQCNMGGWEEHPCDMQSGYWVSVEGMQQSYIIILYISWLLHWMQKRCLKVSVRCRNTNSSGETTYTVAQKYFVFFANDSTVVCINLFLRVSFLLSLACTCTRMHAHTLIWESEMCFLKNFYTSDLKLMI